MRATPLLVQRCVAGFIFFIGGLLGTASAQLTTPASGAVAAGNNFTVALKADGTVWTWGTNYHGQLGNGTFDPDGLLANGYFDPSFVPTPVVGSLTNVVRIAVGGDLLSDFQRTLALKSDGTVWRWGSLSPQTGDPAADTSVPAQIVGVSGVMAIASGPYHDLAVKSDGTVWGWGYNNAGALGSDNLDEDIAEPIQIEGIENAVSVAARMNGSIALKADGTVWAWGDYDLSSPVQVLGLTNIIQIVAGTDHCMALKNDGTVYAWGANSKGQLGDGTKIWRQLPVVIPSLNNVVFIAAGYQHSLAIRADGTAWAWGWNMRNQLGDGTAIDRSIPVQIPNANAITSLAGGLYDSVLLADDGSVITVGHKVYASFGDGDIGIRAISYPVQVGARTDFSKIDIGRYNSLAVTQGGQVWGWGQNGQGILGNGTTSAQRTPVLITSLSNIGQVDMGASHSLFKKNDGTVWAAGNNSNGQLGDGTITARSTPVQVVGLSGITDVAAGASHSLALKNDGTVWAWGFNTNGRLGDGTTTQRTAPVQITSLSGIIAIAAGDAHSLALKSDGTVWAWGLNSNGRLGDGTTTQRTAPVQVKGAGGVGFLGGVVALSAGTAHNLALKSDGTIWVWGSNANGRLGDGTTTQRTTPVKLAGISGITSVAAGGSHSLAIKTDGSVLAWGLNTSGQLGDRTNAQHVSPVGVSNVENAVAVSAGVWGSMALQANGTLRIWGTMNTSVLLGCGPLYRGNSAINLKSTSFDADSDGMPDAWETAYFGNITQAATDDPDFDGLNNIQEYAGGANPILPDADQDLLTDVVDAYPGDFYNGVVPLITIVGGNNQTATAGDFNADAFEVAVWDPTGTTPFVNAPVTFAVLYGGGQLATANLGSPVLTTTLSVSTDIDGSALAYYKHSNTPNMSSQIRASASTAQVTFTSASQGSTDTTPPSTPASLFTTALTSSSFTLHWAVASDAVGVTGYDIFKDSSWIGDSAANQFSVTGLTAATAYSMTVKARDAAGNVSAASQALSVTTQSAAPSTTAWEVAFFGAAGVNFSANPDGDALTNLQEYEQGRHPLVSDDGIAFYVDAVLGNDTTYNGHSVWPGLPTAAHGPKATLTAAVTAAATGDTILILSSPSAYQATTLSLTGKNLVLRPMGNVSIHP